MTPGDAARVLAACALFDNRKVTDDEDGVRLVRAWFSVIGDLPLEDALEAVRRHYRDSTDWCMPKHVRAGARAIAAERARARPSAERQLPSGFEQDVTRAVHMRRGAAGVREVLGPLLERLAAKSDSDKAPDALDALRAITPGPDWKDADSADEGGK